MQQQQKKLLPYNTQHNYPLLVHICSRHVLFLLPQLLRGWKAATPRIWMGPSKIPTFLLLRCCCCGVADVLELFARTGPLPLMSCTAVPGVPHDPHPLLVSSTASTSAPPHCSGSTPHLTAPSATVPPAGRNHHHLHPTNPLNHSGSVQPGASGDKPSICGEFHGSRLFWP